MTSGYFSPTSPQRTTNVLVLSQALFSCKGEVWLRIGTTSGQYVPSGSANVKGEQLQGPVGDTLRI